MSADTDNNADMAALREFALASMQLEEASVSLNEDEETATVTTTSHDGGDRISVSRIIDEVTEHSLYVTDVVADFDSETVTVEVRA